MLQITKSISWLNPFQSFRSTKDFQRTTKILKEMAGGKLLVYSNDNYLVTFEYGSSGDFTVVPFKDGEYINDNNFPLSNFIEKNSENFSQIVSGLIKDVELVPTFKNIENTEGISLYLYDNRA